MAEAVPEALIADPLSGEAFHYDLKSDDSYRLYSKGTSATGEIELMNKRVAGAGAGSSRDPNEPPG